MNEISRNLSLQAAFGAHLKSGAQLLAAWKDSLDDTRAVDLAGFEAKGFRIGLALTLPRPKNAWVAHVLVVDPRGEFRIFETIELVIPGGGALNSQNLCAMLAPMLSRDAERLARRHAGPTSLPRSETIATAGRKPRSRKHYPITRTFARGD